MRTYARLLGLIIVLGTCSGVLMAFGSRKDDDIRANGRILDTLPGYPDAHRVKARIEPVYEYHCDEDCVPLGHRTYVAYRIPSDVKSRDVVDFYVEHLRNEGWTADVDELIFREIVPRTHTGPLPEPQPTGDYSVAFTRGDTLIYLGTRTTSWAGGADTIGISVDHEALAR